MNHEEEKEEKFFDSIETDNYNLRYIIVTMFVLKHKTKLDLQKETRDLYISRVAISLLTFLFFFPSNQKK